MQFLITSFSVACQFVDKHHRHLKHPRGHKFSIAAIDNEKTLGVLIAGRPVNRNFTPDVIEFTRVCVIPNQKNLCSQLLAAARKEAKKRKFTKAITYIRADETGASLRADNWQLRATVRARQWHGRKTHEVIAKQRFEFQLQ